jgi:hypothetical protein
MSTRGLVVTAIIGLVAVALFAFGIRIDPQGAAAAYLVAYGVACSIALGALVFVMIGHVTGARWFVPLRPYGDALSTLLVPLAVLVVPIVLAAHWLYPWARSPATLDPALAEAIARKRAYLNLPFFTTRAIVFAVTWAVLAGLLARWSRAHASSPTEALASRMRALSGAALPPLALTLTFAAFDWFMSIEPAWYSNAYGFYFFSGGFAGAVAATTLLAYFARRAGFLTEEVGASHFHACGRVLLAAVSVWAYIAFAQFFLVWIADIPEEARWYVLRTQGPWRPVAITLAIVHFAVPFFALLQRAVTRHPARLALVAGWVLAAHVLDLYWLIVPAFHPEGPRASWIELAAIVAIGSASVALITWRMRRVHVVPNRDPAWRLGLRYEST